MGFQSETMSGYAFLPEDVCSHTTETFLKKHMWLQIMTLDNQMELTETPLHCFKFLVLKLKQ